ncbi:NrsF family protein [Pseudoroseomonas wenyumeiae]
MHGLICAASIAVLALPMLGMLAYLMRKGASVHAESSALAVGMAGGSWGAFVFAFCCPVNDPLYILAWYSLGCAAVVLPARFILPKYAAL